MLLLYPLHADGVMSNPVHMLVRPGGPLERITRVLEGFTARQAIKILEWQATGKAVMRSKAQQEHRPSRPVIYGRQECLSLPGAGRFAGAASRGPDTGASVPSVDSVSSADSEFSE